MKIYIITCEPFPHGMAATNRIICYAKALRTYSVECEVIIYHRSEVHGKKPNNIDGEGIYEGIPFKYIGQTPLRASSKLMRYWHDMKDKEKTILYLKNRMNKGDAILCYLREDPFAIQLQKFAHHHGYKIIRDFCEYPFASSVLTPKTEKLCEKYMKTTFQDYDGAICISQPLLNLAFKYNPVGKFIKVPILIDELKWNFDKVSPFSINYPYIFHSGSLLQQKDGILNILKAFGEALPLLPSNIKYLFTGNLNKTNDKESINKIIEKYNLESHIIFLGYLTQEEIFKYIKGAKLFIVYKINNLQNKYCFATKLGEYLLSGNPVITTDVGESKYYLNSKNAYIVETEDYKELSKVIISVFSDKNATKIGNAGKTVAIENFSIKSQGIKLKQYFETL